MRRISSAARVRAAAVLVALAALAASAPATPLTAAAQTGSAVGALPGLQRTERSEPSPGVFVERWNRSSPPMVVRVARVTESARHRLRVVVSNEQVAEPDPAGRLERTSRMCRRYHCVVATNADQHLLAAHGRISGVPVGPVVSAGELVSSPRPSPYAHAAIGADGHVRGSIDPPAVTAELEAGDGTTLGLDAVNRDLESGDGVGLLTARWGPHTLGLGTDVEWLLPVEGAGVRDGTRLELRPRRHGPGSLGSGQAALVGRGSGVARVEEFIARAGGAGAPVTVRIDLGGALHLVGGSPLLLDGGRYAFPVDAFATSSRQPRTVLGWSPGGDLLLVTVDGRRPGHSDGASLVESAQVMRSLGATGALNLDGGGSTTFVQGLEVRNRPSDPGGERRVTTALVVGPPEGFDFGEARARPLEPFCDPAEPVAAFDDVPATNVHAGAVGCLAGAGLAAGRSPARYEPAGVVTRAQMASFVVRALGAAGHPMPPDPPDAFADDEVSVHEPNIDALAAIGVVSGRSDGSFGPRSSVSRAQTASLLVRAWRARTGETAPPQQDFHTDDSLNVHETAINTVSELGLMAGPGPGVFEPGLGTRRDQMASVLARLMADLSE